MRRARALCAGAALLLLVSCAGLKAREHVLIPAMNMAWVGISADIDVGMATLTIDAAALVRAEQQRMTAALGAGDIAGVLLVDWRLLRKVAHRGIDLRRWKHGQIGPGVAESLRERLRVFTRALLKLEQGT